MSDRRPNRRRFLALCGATLTAGLAGCGSLSGAPSESDGQSTSTAATDPQVDSGGQSSAESVYNRVYRETIDSVVFVKMPQGQGTGFVYDDSHVVTNAHVVGQASTAQLRFSQGEWSRGSVVGRDPHSDLGVIEVDSFPSSATPLSFMDDEPVVGQKVMVIGNPFNLDGSATSGIVSGTDRLLPALTGFQIPDAIQTDAAVNPGNSGGPLMSLDSTVVGVVNSKRGDNIAFGISAALTQRVVPRLIETGDYEHAYMGVTFRDVTPTIAQANDMSEPRGLVIFRVLQGGPADGVFQNSNLRIVDQTRVPVGGDIVLAIDGTAISTSEDLASYLALQTRPGDTVTFRILRDGTEQTVEMELGSRPERPSGPPVR